MLREKAIVIPIGYKNSESSKHKMKKQKPDNDKYRKSSYSTNLTTMYGNKISFELVHLCLTINLRWYWIMIIILSPCRTLRNVIQTQKYELYISLINFPHPFCLRCFAWHSLIHTYKRVNMAACSSTVMPWRTIKERVSCHTQDKTDEFNVIPGTITE